MTTNQNGQEMTKAQGHFAMWCIGIGLAPFTGGASLGIAACHSITKACMDVAHDEGVKEGQTMGDKA